MGLSGVFKFYDFGEHFGVHGGDSARGEDSIYWDRGEGSCSVRLPLVVFHGEFGRGGKIGCEEGGEFWCD